MKGKDFFSRKSKSDMFETPYSMTEQLLENEKFDYNKLILEPACGNYAIFDILSKNFKRFRAHDINHEAYCCRKNFLFENDYKYKINYIITNPPFSLWDQFVQKAKQITTEKFAFLGRLEFLTGINRFENNLYNDPEYPLTKVYIFVRKINLSFTKEYPCLREDGKYPAGMYHYAWFIFEKENNILIQNDFNNRFNDNFPIIKWINNQKYILRKKEL